MSKPNANLSSLAARRRRDASIGSAAAVVLAGACLSLGASLAGAAVPAAAGAVRGISLDGFQAVSCASATACVAVGATGTSTTSKTFAAGWNGTKWAAEPTLQPSGATTSYLLGVACPTTKSCTAVGEYLKKSGLEYPMAEGWNGSKWALDTVPAVSGSPNTAFLAVACPSATSCLAVGSSGTPRYTPYAFSELWNGSKWVIETTPSPSGAAKSFLTGVSCASTKWCLAVGYYVTATGVQKTLGETWNGTKWSIVATPAPAGASASALDAVSCTAASACTAVADYTSGTKGVAAAESLSGTKWSQQPVPAPSGATGEQLEWVSCTSTKSCVAAGDDTGAKSVDFALTAVWNGSKWVAQQVAGPSGSLGTGLAGVSCTSTKGCSAVGAYAKSATTDATLAEGWNGTKWAVQSTPN
jgi:hypothetical protein